MTGFSPAWLRLREPADQAARSARVLEACRAFFANHEHIAVCDLGAGTGASVRAFAGLLPPRQRWTLIDHDAGNLAAAVAALAEWADTARQDGDMLVLTHGGRRIEIETRTHDLASAPCAWTPGTDLVTASALMDLTSAAWIARFVAALRTDRTPVLATLSFNGVMAPDPAHALDAAVAAGFHEHQRRDKGFGPSAGPDAARILEETLKNAGYAISADESPWVLGADATRLLQTTVDDMANAVLETGAVAADALAQWRAHAHNAGTFIVGHRDVFAALT